MTDSANFHLANATEFSPARRFFYTDSAVLLAGTVVDPGYEDCQFRRAWQGQFREATAVSSHR